MAHITTTLSNAEYRAQRGLAALVAETGLTEEQGKAVIRAIGQKLIPAVSISY